MEIETITIYDYSIISVMGELNWENNKKLKGTLEDYLQKEIFNIGLDFSRVTYADTDLVNTLVKYYKKITDLEGNLKIIHPSKEVSRLLETFCLNEIIDVVDTADEIS